jgi:Ca-activated chloride channel family protein
MSRLWSAAFLALLLLVTTHPSSQALPTTTIHGSVVNAQLAPIAGAAIALDRNGREVANAVSDSNGKFTFTGIAAGSYTIRATHAGFPAFTRSLNVSGASADMQLPIVMTRPEDLQPRLEGASASKNAVTAAMPAPPPAPILAAAGGGRGGGAQVYPQQYIAARPMLDDLGYAATGETYAPIHPNRFERTSERKLSTFGADVDTASFTNVRRFLSTGQFPPSDAVRVEELVNYFRFDYPAPRDGKPVAITTEIGDCPWAPSHKLVLIGARAATPPRRQYAGRNLVLLIDVSGSMQPAERLPLIKTALGMFADTLTAKDTIAIVTYAGNSGIALAPTNGANRRAIHDAIAELGAGGSTNGAQGLIAAYRIARQSFIPGGINRVILATDGDFNVGITSQADLYRLIERERDSGVFLSVLGVGSGNLKDQTMEMLADKGNGNYSYIDSLHEARRVLISEGDATLTTVAKDVKFQVEFNPEHVAEWKLIGYENRKMAARDFENDRKDAGDMGAGHTVTVLYEIVTEGVKEGRSAKAEVRNDWFTVNARYKLPESETSELLTHHARPSERLEFLPFASAVAEFGLLLRDFPRDTERWDALSRRLASMPAPEGVSDDKRGFEEMVSLARAMAGIPRR